MTASKLPYFPGNRKLFVHSFFFNPQSNPPGSDKPEPSPNGCTCTRCRVTAIHREIIEICSIAPRDQFERLAEIAMQLSDHTAGRVPESRRGLSLIEIHRLIIVEIDCGGDPETVARLRAVAVQVEKLTAEVPNGSGK